MMTQESLRDEYCPARIHQCTAPNRGHIKQFSFNNERLTRPSAPREPELIETKDWKPIWLTIALIFSLWIPGINVLGLFGLAGLWTWACLVKLPEYKKATKKARIDYQKKREKYEIAKNNYEKVLLPKWEKDKHSQLLKQKMQEDWVEAAIDEAWKRKSWRVHSPEEIQNTRAQGYIGKGEDPLVNALLKTQGIHTFHQVEIEPYYTADIVCLNPETGKLCIAEVDGSHHWSVPDQIEKDNRRMALLAAKGVPTIRFTNTSAERSPYECIQHIQKLLS